MPANDANSGCFYFSAILGLLSAVLLAFAYQPHKKEEDEGSYTSRLARLDWIGAFMLCGALVPLMIGKYYSQLDSLVPINDFYLPSFPGLTWVSQRRHLVR